MTFLGQSKKFWFLAVSFLVVIGGLLAGLVLVQQRQVIEKQAAVANAQLSFSPESFTDLEPNDSVQVTVMVNPMNQPIVAVDTVVNFNNSILQLQSVQPGTVSSNRSWTAAPITSETNCAFSFDTNAANSSGRLEFGMVAFDCPAEVLADPISIVINDLARLNFVVRPDAAAGTYNNAISFKYDGDRNTTDANIVIDPAANGDVVEDILQAPTSTVNLSVVSVGPDKASLTFKVKLQGIGTNNNNTDTRTATVTLKQAGQVVATYDNVTIANVNDNTGHYQGTINNIDPGTYEVLVKGWAHMQKRLATSLTLAVGDNNVDWTSESLRAGDVWDTVPTSSNYNMIDMSDLAKTIRPSVFLVLDGSVPAAELALYDTNLDGVIDMGDLAKIISNFAPGVYGDE